MTDPPTLFLNTSQVRPSWTNNGLTLALNLGSTHGANVSCTGANIYEAHTFAGANEATAGALFAPVVDQGNAHTPVRVALSNGASNWTQTTSIAEPGISTSIGSATITTSDCTSPASSASVTSAEGGAESKTWPSFRPIAMKKDANVTPCQVAEITTSSLYSKSGDSCSKSPGGIATGFKSQQNDLTSKSNMVTVVAASSASATSTTPAISSNGTSSGTGLVTNSVGSSFANTLAASTSITLSSAGIPVGIAIARQRYVANSETVANKQTTTAYKDAYNVSCSAAVVAPSSSASYSSVIPCHSTILSSGFATTPLGVIAESINCPSKHANEMAPTVTNLQPFWSTQTTGISGTATLPMSIAQQQSSQTQQASGTTLPITIPAQTQQSAQTLTAAQSSLAIPHQHAAVSQWHSYTGASLESQIATGMPSTCGGYQIARDSVSGQYILIPTGQIDSSVRQRNVFLIPSAGVQQTSATATAAACSTTNHHQTQQSFFISQQQSPSPSYSIVLDHLVTATSALPAAPIVKQKPPTGIPSAATAVVKLDNGLLTTGVMMPCGLAKSSPLQHNNASAAIGQQLISANNSSFSLVQQLTSSNVHNSNVNIPHHFSTISSSGSLVIQQISGNTMPSPLINQVNNSLLISAEAAATQSILNAQPPQYVPNNTSFLFNTRQLTSTSSSSSLSSVPENVVSSYADGSTPSSTSFIISTSCGANRNDIGTGITLATSASSSAGIIPIDDSSTSSSQYKISNNGAVSCDVATATTTIGATCTSILADNNPGDGIQNDDDRLTVKASLSEDVEEQQITMIKSNDETWSVQDAGNQTETNDGDQDACYDTDKKSIDSDSSDESNRLKIDPDHESSSGSEVEDEEINSYEKETPAKDAETPDFSGLQLLLNGIEQVEHVRSADTEAVVVAAPEKEIETKDKAGSTQTPNGLEILCALADQRFYEENEDDKPVSSRSASGISNKKSVQQRSRDSSDDDKISLYRYKNDDSPMSNSSRLFDSKHDRSVSPYEGNQQKMRLELARLQKKYRETRKVLDRLTHGKYAAVSSSSTRSPTPLKDYSATPGSSEPDYDSKSIMTPIKRRPGRPRKNSDPSLTSDKNPCAFTTPSYKSPRPKPKLKLYPVQDSSPEKTTSNGDLSPPVLEPMCPSAQKMPKSFKSSVLSPPTLLPSKKSQLLQSPFSLRPKRSYALRDDLDGFSSSEPDENDENEIDSEEEDCEGTRHGAYGNYALKVKKNFYKSGCLDENDKEMTGSKRPLPGKRKVGRPRKKPKVERSSQTLNETSHCKNQNKRISPFLTGVSKFSKFISSAMLESQRKPIHSSQFFDKESKPKITPKLKAEAKLKTWRQESPSPEATSPRDSIDCPFIFTTSSSSSMVHKTSHVAKSCTNISLSDDEDEANYHLSRPTARRPSTHVSSNFASVKRFKNANCTFDTNSSATYGAVTDTAEATATIGVSRDCSSNDDFRITAKLLEDVEANPIRVLIAVGGLFRAGQLSAVRAPDLYGIKLDGERGHRTHIYTKEEVLRDVVLEVEGKYPLKNGTRVCAFWSSQYLSLYPGYVTSFSSSDESEDEYFTSVEFDDGDSGRINIKDIRLLPKNFRFSRRTSPDDLTQYHKNHDHHKRKRRISGVSFEEIPVDKQLHSPKTPSSLSPEETGQDDESSESRRISADSSARKSFTEYEDTGSRSSSFDQNEPESRSNFEPSTSGDEAVAAKIHRREELGSDSQHQLDSKNTSQQQQQQQKRHLKKKRKDKLRTKDSAGSSFKRKSHKCDDNEHHDSDSRKLHKRHKHKHKHRKHHKRKRSSSSERKYSPSNQNGSDARGETNANNGLDILCRSGADCSTDSCCNKNNNNGGENITCKCKTKRTFDEKHEDVFSVAAFKNERNDQTSSMIKKEEIHRKIDISSKLDVSSSVLQKQSKSYNEDDNEDFHSTSNLSGSVTKPQNRKTVRPQISATVNHKQSYKFTPSEEVRKEEKERKDAEEDDGEDEVEVEVDEGTTGDLHDNQDDDNSGENFWEWFGKGFKRNGKGRAKKEFFQAIKRGDVEIRVGDCAVFLTADNSPKPFIGRIKSMWECYGNMMVLVKWFYHPEETSGLNEKLPFLGGLFESPHDDKNDVQTISHKCEVVSIKEYRERLKKEPERIHNVYESNDVYYLAGHYDPTNKRLTLEKDVVS